MKDIPPLYHWSPSRNRAAILSEGLLPTCPSGKIGLAVCLGTDPLSAWSLSGDLHPEEPHWDLFQVHVSDTYVCRRKHWGRLVEYRIPRPILPRGVTYVGSRTFTKAAP